MSLPTDTADPAGRVVAAVLADMLTERAVVVDSPPGAGKSTLVIAAARLLAASSVGQVMVVAQTNEQVDDLTTRLALADPALPVGRFSAAEYRVPTRVTAQPSVTVASALADLGHCAVVIGTAAKWGFVREGRWRHAIIDEAYQMRSDMLLRIAARFERGLFVGDPGQLDPFSTIETTRWTGLTWDPMQSAVAVLLRHNPTTVTHRLPVSWRLPSSAAPVVSDAFYPFNPFVAGSAPGSRRLRLSTTALHASPIDETISMAAASGWALHELPARHTVRTDEEAVATCARIARRLLERGATATSDGVESTVTPSTIAIGTAHRDQAVAIRAALGPQSSITVDTANRLQGREYDVTIVLHPLSGRRDATAFHLETGRLCVLTSRHRQACIVVARAGIQELLDAHPSTEPVHLNVPVKFPDGWEANQAILAHLQPHKIRSV